ncbi:uncharacterized protein MYCFIDRAFT_85250 [Pseudocercospora fijiensis CIRAD86]|uniref:2EXR domain-containing protein n=1 Tax=Pseudocercospora fijiensis (strain CIRAD86) TaxID=383855 RepID=M3AKX8_PSEFD|nr:uncharacterized protein MYCFIDRAFT_85250 [Pseudocercospora fijiensis CIRAD86]EME85226.1 hypothetical protein MYCFIDRAFT_85250 [Pseudocercospora fijiensis CIRAD86]
MANATASEAATVRTSKRKRNQVSYLDDDHFSRLNDIDDEPAVHEDQDIVEGDPEDLAFGTKRGGRGVKRRAVKKAKKPPTKKKQKQKPFRFLDLPPELRDEIYELALVEPKGLTLVSRTKSHRRTIARGAISVTDSKYYYGKARRRRFYWPQDDSQSSIENHRDRQLIPNLLAVNQQIRDEASTFLYKQEIVLADTTALLQFIATIGSYNRKLINDIVVRGWGGDRGVTRGHNFSALTSLAECTNLDSLYFDCSVSHSLPRLKEQKKLAGQIYRDGHFFLEAYATANGLEAALKVVQFGDRQFAKDRGAKKLEFDQSKRDEFENELETLMKKGGFKVRSESE